jgi:hypothetical protein
MSKYGWEQGTIVLPSVSIAPLRNALNAYMNTLHTRALTDARNFWSLKAKQTRSTKLYTERVQAYISEVGRASTPSTSLYSYSPRPSNAYTEDQLYDLSDLLSSVASSPRRLTAEEIAKHFPKCTNRTTSWPVGHEASISLKGRVVSWSVADNNHSVERAHDEPIASVFFGFLGKVKWTRGTGGVGSGNDEYNSDNRESGGGANYTTFSYGPLGEREFAFRTGFNRKTLKRVRRF